MAENKDDERCSLPISRIRTIMKSSPDVSSISQEALFITGKATELFVQNLALVSLERSKEKHNVTYKDLADIVNDNEILQFLQDIIPQKIKAQDYLDMLAQKDEEDS